MKGLKTITAHADNVRPFLGKTEQHEIGKISSYWGFDDHDDDASENELDSLLPDEAFGLLAIEDLEERAKIAFGPELVNDAHTFAASSPHGNPTARGGTGRKLLAIAIAVAAIIVLFIQFDSSILPQGTDIAEVIPISQSEVIPITQAEDDDVSVGDPLERIVVIDAFESSPNHMPVRDEDVLAIASFQDLLGQGMLKWSSSGNGWKEEYSLHGRIAVFFQINLTESAGVVFSAARNINLSGGQIVDITNAIKASTEVDATRMRVGDVIYGYLTTRASGEKIVQLYYVPKFPSRMLNFWGLETSAACNNPVVVSSAGHFVPQFGAALKRLGRLEQVSPCQMQSLEEPVPDNMIVRISANN